MWTLLFSNSGKTRTYTSLRCNTTLKKYFDRSIRSTREGLGLGKVSDGLGKVSDGFGMVLDGIGKVADGHGKMWNGLGKVADGF